MPTDALLTLDAASLPEGVCYRSEQERFNGFIAALRVMLPGNFGTVNQGSDTPSVDDRDKPWLRDNPDGSPDGTYKFFDGSWKRRHGTDPGAIMLWLGNSADIDTLDGGATGTVSTESGPFWAIATEFAARFPIGVGTLPSAGAIAVTDVGGEERHTLITKELPAVLGSFATDVLKAVAKTSTGVLAGAAFTPGGPWNSLDFEEFIKGGTDDVDKSHNNLPPFVTTYFIERTARIYYSI